MKVPNGHYTFGDNDVAAERLRLLAEAYERSTRELLRRLEPARPRTVVDLGCGAGYTTDLLCGALDPERVTGLDRSPRLLAIARGRVQGRVQFLEHDVATAPLPGTPADVLYARFLLTHLNDVGGVLSRWKTALTASGVIVLEETAGMVSDHPALRRYYAMVESMQAHYGQALTIGRSLEALSRTAGLSILDSFAPVLAQPAERMARLHAMNLRTWRSDPFAREAFDPKELEALSATLLRIADGLEPASPVACEMKQLVLCA